MSDANKHYTRDFDDVLKHELEEVETRRKAVLGQVPTKKDESETDRVKAMRMNLIGLSLCGGGIRSATFGLGFLQALGTLDLVKRLDYISSVSGGGYIHAWLAAWIRRETSQKQPIAVENVSKQLSPSRVTQAQATRNAGSNEVQDEEPSPVRHLREFSRFLAPRSGLLGLDSTAIVGLYFRNLLANGLIFVAAGICLSLCCRLLLLAFGAGRAPEHANVELFVSSWSGSVSSTQWPAWGLVIWTFTLLLIGQLYYRWCLAGVRKGPVFTDDNNNGMWIYRQLNLIAHYIRFFGIIITKFFPVVENTKKEPKKIVLAIVLPCLISTLALFWLLGPTYQWESRLPGYFRKHVVSSGDTKIFSSFDCYYAYFQTFGLLGIATWIIGLPLEWYRRQRTSAARNSFSYLRAFTRIIGSYVSGASFGTALCAIVDNFGFISAPGMASGAESALFVAYGPSMLMLAFSVSGYLETIVGGWFISEVEREWRARVGAMFLIAAVTWATVFSVVFYLPWLIYSILSPNNFWAVIGGWAASGVATYVLRPSEAEKPTKSRGSLVKSWALVVAPLVFLAGLVALASVLAHSLHGVAGKEGDFLDRCISGNFVLVSLWLLVIAIFGTVYACFVDPNLFSLHSLYGNRLVRCYLAASRRKRGWALDADKYDPSVPSPGVPTGDNDAERIGEPFTGFGHRDDFSLLWLQPDKDAFPGYPNFVEEPWKRVPNPDSKSANDEFLTFPYLGPYPLFNTTMNLVGGSDLATQDRKGESFVLSPGYCGSKITGWARLKSKVPADNRNLTVGRAMTISGAAVDPNMTNHQSAGLTALLTLLNVRLGWWIQNPWKTRPKKDGGNGEPWTAKTPWSASYLLHEGMGNTRADKDYVHLSDGGHFENTGAYELIRRRCRFIVLVDSAEDPLDYSENLANLIRLVRTDFGIRIEIETSPLRKDASGLSAAHVAVGIIRYDDVDHGAINGTLIFLRSSLTGDEPADLKNYADVNPPFPHHGAQDLFFDEPQFESYRLLGYHIGMQVFGPAVDEINREKPDEKNYGRKLFSELRRRWALLPVDLLKKYDESVNGWLRLEETMRSDDRVGRLTLDIYPELLRAVGGESTTPTDVLNLAKFDHGRPAPQFLTPIDPAILTWMAKRGQKRVVELRVMAQLVQMMETSWMKMDLDDTFAHPVQRGWMNCFRRYTSADVFQEYWPVLRPMYSHGFVRFCERVLAVAPLPVEVVRWDSIADSALKTELSGILNDEFDREWAVVLDGKPDWEKNYLKQSMEQALPDDAGPLIWIFRYGVPGNKSTNDAVWGKNSDELLPHYPLGVAIVQTRNDDAASDPKPCNECLELVFWIRGSHRTSDVGKEALPQVLKQIDKVQSELKLDLMVRFPRVGGTAADSTQRAMWTTFFNDHEFASYQLRPEIAKKEIRARRKLQSLTEAIQ